MTDCGCSTRSHLYVIGCDGCDARHLARSMPYHRREALTVHRKQYGQGANDIFKQRVAREYALDHEKGGLYAGE